MKATAIATLIVLAHAGAVGAASSVSDFDFLIGKRWHVENRVLKERLAGSNEWLEFDAVLEDVRKIAGGHGNVDSFKAERNGAPFEGNSVRVFDPSTNQWTIFWIDSTTPVLAEQVVGEFEDGVGTFYGNETFRGRATRLRFLWTEVTEQSARWEQAYFDEGAGEWETNWVMEFTVISER